MLKEEFGHAALTVEPAQEAERWSNSGLTWQQGSCQKELKAWSFPLESTTSGRPAKGRGLSRGDHATCSTTVQQRRTVLHWVGASSALASIQPHQVTHFLVP